MTDDLTEHKLLELIKDKVDTSQKNVLGWDEDAVAVDTINGRKMLINIDGWVASTDRPPGMKVYDCAYRAAINAISDIYAKGGKPMFMVVSSSMPSNMKNEMEALVSGLVDACSDYNVHYLGGDMNSSTDFVIDVVVIGYSKKLIKRSTASVGEYVCWMGNKFGNTAAALGILVDQWKAGDTQEEIKANTRKALDIMAKPDLFPEFLKIPATSAIDCSDGLAISLDYIARLSEICIILEDNMENYMDPWARAIAKINNKQHDDLIFYGGEELGIVFTVPVHTDLSLFPENIAIIGKTAKMGSQSSIIYRGKALNIRGWEHFS